MRRRAEFRSRQRGPMQSLLRVVAVLSALALAAPGPVTALNGDSCGGEPAGVVAELLASAAVETPDHPVMLELLRIELAPAERIDSHTTSGPTLMAVDSGHGVVVIGAEALLVRSDVTSLGLWTEPAAISGTVALNYGDYVSVPAGVEIAFDNSSGLPFVLNVFRVVAISGDLSTFRASDSLRDSASVALLARGVVTDVPAPGATMGLVRLLFRPGDSERVHSANLGPMLIAVEEGTLGYTLVDGAATLVRPDGDVIASAVQFNEVVIDGSAAVVELLGAESELRSVSTDRTWALLAEVSAGDGQSVCAPAPDVSE